MVAFLLGELKGLLGGLGTLAVGLAPLGSGAGST